MSVASPMIESLRVRGFRSLEDVALSGLPAATVLIGPNGSGKSNLLRFLYLLHYMLRYRDLGRFVEKQGGAGEQLFGGPASTYQIAAETVRRRGHKAGFSEEPVSSHRITAEITLKIGGEWYDYRFALEYAHPDHFFFGREAFRHRSNEHYAANGWQDLGRGHREANLPLAGQPGEFSHLDRAAATEILQVLRTCEVYQFHNTDALSYLRRNADVRAGNRLRTHGGNLAAVLYQMEREDRRRYERICRYIGRILPGFAQFDLEENHGKVALRWHADWSNRRFGAHLTSDGSLRLFALITLLNMPPEKLPAVILLDEPELGLHTARVSLIGGMISSLATRKQVIVATQSPQLVDDFGLDQIFVLELRKGRTEVRRHNPEEYRHWLDEYATGELWEKNLLGGRP